MVVFTGNLFTANMAHHLCGLSLLWSIFKIDSSVLPYVPKVGFMEFTTPILNTLWFFQVFHLSPSSKRYRTAALSFVVAFFLLRVVYFPFILFYSLPRDRMAVASLGWRMQPLRILAALQVYWFVKIVRKFVK